MALLRSTDILTKDTVATELGITSRSAANLLQRWASEGTVHRTAPGEYISSFASENLEQVTLQSVANRVGNKLIFVGASAWKRVGWCDSPVMHLAAPLRPSRVLPRMKDVVIYPVGARLWLQLASNAVQMDLDKPPVLHPIAQMLWWMNETNSPVEMPSPERINWGAIKKDPLIAQAMMQKWPELTGTAEELDIQLLYRMLHVDRLRGVVPGGLAEPIDPADEDADQVPLWGSK
jgi:hypothetical protein